MNGKWKLGLVIALVVIVSAIVFLVTKHKAEVKADKTGMKNHLVCKNEDDDWVKIPAGFYRGGDGVCVEGTPPPPPAPVVKPEYPTSGEGHATKEIGLKAWLDPRKTHTRPSRPARYVFVEDPEVSFDDVAGSKVEINKTWQDMPAGKYLVYPLKGDKVYFRWWQ